MIKSVLFPTDFSDSSFKVKNYLLKLKEAGLQKVVLLNVIDRYSLDDAIEECEYKFSKNLRECIRHRKQELISERERKLYLLGNDLGISYEIVVRRGKPFKVIIKTAKEFGVDLIVMGSHGKGKIEELLLGSVAENVVRHSPIPVMVIK